MPTWNPRANDLFLKALAMGPAGVPQEYLDGACAGDAALRAEVESLLDASARAGSFLESAAPVPVEGVVPHALIATDAQTIQPSVVGFMRISSKFHPCVLA